MNSNRGEEQCEIVKLHIQFQKYFHNDFMHCVANVYHEKKLGISFFAKNVWSSCLETCKRLSRMERF